MFGVGTHELLIVAVLALLFIGPKELPTAMRTVGRWIGKVRGMARQFTSGFEEVVREAELEEMDRKWREDNDRIMRDYPALPQMEAETDSDQPALPLPPPDDRRERP
ncbi:MAG: Sec-independent protein translocase protein TatB [Pseudomonadota bacterium]|nr:Sec-independent protein translocase protein TatB [Pseudomonadota bacterium]